MDPGRDGAAAVGMPTVAVLLTMCNAADHIASSLHQLDDCLRGVAWGLFVADNGSTDGSLERARSFRTGASPTIIVGFPAATSAVEQFDRLVRLAVPWADQFEYTLFTNSWEFYPDKLARLLAQTSRNRQPIAVGDAEWLDDCRKPCGRETAGEAIHFDRVHPFATVIETRLTPLAFGQNRGPVFAEGPIFDVSKLREEGFHVCNHGGEPVCGVDASRTGTQQKGAASAGQREPGIRSLCTIVFGPESTAEALLMLRSFRLFNAQPVLVMCDELAEGSIRAANIADIEYLRGDWRQNAEPFENFTGVMSGSAALLNPSAMLSKMDVIPEAIRRYGNTLFVDCDVVFLNPLWARPRCDVMLSPELSMIAALGWRKYGAFNGGCVFFGGSEPDLLRWWREDYLKNWRRFGALDQPTGCFLEQSSLDLFPMHAACGVFPPSYNVGASVLSDEDNLQSLAIKMIPHGTGPLLDAIAAHSGLRADWGLWLRGWPVVSVHCHFVHPHWHATWPRLLLHLIRRVDRPEYRAIAAEIGKIYRGSALEKFVALASNMKE